MREIIFRGKREDGEGWVYGGISVFHGLADIFDHDSIDNTCYPVIHETVGQFTGLTDSKGVKIFSDDIVKRTVNIRDYAECDGEAVEYYSVFFQDCCFYPFADISNRMDEYEVVGNIFDNPELIAE